MAFKAVTITLVLAAAALATTCGDGDTVAPTEEPGETSVPSPVEVRPTAEAPEPTGLSARTLATGEFQLPAARAFGQPGFHQVLEATQELPSDLGRTAGQTLVLKLWDAGRIEQTCSRDHPLSGCATVDWSDAESRPGVPPGGVFDNHLSFELATGPQTLFLSDTDALIGEPNEYVPG